MKIAALGEHTFCPVYPLAPMWCFIWVQGAQASLQTHGASVDGACLHHAQFCPSAFWVELYACRFSEQQVIIAQVKELSVEGEIIPV